MASSCTKQSPKSIAIVDANGCLKVYTGKEPAAQAYEYAPLPSKGNHLRLVRLHPGPFDSPIQVDIEIYEIGFRVDKPDYWALSYTWSDPENDNLIIDGKRISPSDEIRSQYDIRHLVPCGSQHIMISTNLRDALRRLRSTTVILTLWIDQLCINQNDLDERSTQVVTMQRIYHEARGVRIWLGEHKDESKLGIELALQLQKLGNDVLAGLKQRPGRNDLHRTTRFGLPHYPDAPGWSAFMKLLARPVFHRIWILQEIVSAVHAQMFCGDTPLFDYQVFVNAIGLLQASEWDFQLTANLDKGKNNISVFITVAAVKHLWLQNPSLELRTRQRDTLLHRTRRFQASDPRDKIFALLPIINDYGHRDLYGVDAPVDFKQSRDHKRREGPLDRLLNNAMKLEDEEEATVIIRKNSNGYFTRLRAALIDFLRAAPKFLEPFLRPSPDQDLKRLHEEAKAAFSALNEPMYDFHSARSDTKEHKTVLAFINDLWKDVISRLQTFCDLLPKAPIQLLLQFADDPSYTDDIEELLKSIDSTLSRLLQEPGEETAEKGDKDPSLRELMAQGKIIIGEPVGGNPPPEKQFHDWAWSALGSTVADYRKDVVEVFTEFTVKCLQDDKSLDIFTDIEDASERHPRGLPSWVPDFSVTMTRNPLPARLNQEERKIVNYRTCGDLSVDLSWDHNKPGQLELEGHVFGKLKWLASEESATGATVTFQDTVSWEAAISSLPKTYKNGQDTFEVYWRTLIGDTVCSSKTFPVPQAWANFYDSFVALLDVNRACELNGRAGGEEAMARRGMTQQSFHRHLQEHYMFVEEMAGVMLQRRLCILEEGYIGVVPLSAKIGDEIWVLKGGSVPFVVRSDGAGKYVMIGECYVHGIMRGEWAEKFAWKKLQLV